MTVKEIIATIKADDNKAEIVVTEELGIVTIETYKDGEFTLVAEIER